MTKVNPFYILATAVSFAANSSQFPAPDFYAQPYRTRTMGGAGEAASDGDSKSATLFFENQNAEPVDLILKGSGFTYGPDGEILTGTVSGYLMTVDGKKLLEVSGLTDVDGKDFYDSVMAEYSSRYNYLVSLLNDATEVTGSKGSDLVAVGAGNDIAVTGAGDDQITKFNAGDLDFDGGKGFDVLSFQSSVGSVYPTATTQQLVVDLRSGEGQNPYGGTLALKDVEGIVGTSQADILSGNNRNNGFGDGVYDSGADVIKGFGGDDFVKLSIDAASVDADGGDGSDTIVFSVSKFGSSGATHKIDLVNPSNNAGLFAINDLVDFENYLQSTKLSYLDTVVDFVGDDDDNTVLIRSAGTIELAGGADKMIMAGLAKTANGGAGKDTLEFYGSVDILDLAEPANSTGGFAGSSFKGFEIYRNLGSDMTFKGSDANETFYAAAGGHDIAFGGGGNDALHGEKSYSELDGGEGKDILIGGKYFDTLTGGMNADTFVLASGDSADHITDFVAKGKDHDTIDLSKVKTIKNYADLKANHLESHGSDLVIDGGHGDSWTLDNLSMHDLSKGAFDF